MKKISLLLAFLAAGVFYLVGCGSQKSEGQRLAELHCQGCHKLPEPNLLDKKTWQLHVLPKMGAFLGFRVFDNGVYFEAKANDVVMPLADWKEIVRYYVSNAPDSLEEKGREKIQTDLKNFTIERPAFGVQSPATTYVAFQPQEQQIFLSDALTQQLYRLSANGALLDSMPVGQGMVNLRLQGTKASMLSMGVLYPSDEKSGDLRIQDLQTKSSHVLLDSLQRPVFAEYSELNGDEKEDIVICEFGNNTGQLGWWENKGNGRFQKHVLRALPGAVRTQILDANRDGRPDIVALMAQGDEGIFLYYNEGNGQFREKRLLQLHPSYGSNYFEMEDVNGDGAPDIVATNGDNGDYPPILKPYHGVRIYLNDGQFNFKEAAFLPMNGACKAIARDFDGDGDVDIASISYFPAYDYTPEESFVYWENEGNLRFHPHSFLQAVSGRWLTMDAGDIDGDGDIDLVLGNAKFTLGYVPSWLMKKWDQDAPSILLLRNHLKK